MRHRGCRTERGNRQAEACDRVPARSWLRRTVCADGKALAFLRPAASHACGLSQRIRVDHAAFHLSCSAIARALFFG